MGTVSVGDHRRGCQMADTCSFGAPFRITLCALALATIMMATCSLTRDTPLNIEDDASEQQILLDQNAWNSPEAGIAAVLLQKKGSLKSLKIKAKSLSKKSATTKKGRTTKKTTKSKKKQGKKQATKKKVPKTAVQKALQAAANAKEAAAKAANAPMNKRGHEIVKRAQNTARDSALAVDAAKASVRALAKAKAKASKAILDAAGGKYMKETGYQGQGGYFGAALKTAFHNGQLSERLKYRDWKKSTVRASATLAFKRGEKTGFQKGFIKGEKRGEIKVLPKAVRKAEHLLAKRKKAIEKIAKRRRKSEKAAALKAAVAKEADKVRKKLKVTRTSASESESALKEFSEEEEEDLEN